MQLPNDEKCDMIPLRERIIIVRMPEKGRERSGLFIPFISNELPPRAKVVSVGPGVVEVKVGDEVLVTRFKGIPLFDNLWLIAEGDVLGVISPVVPEIGKEISGDSGYPG